ncbi:hypothetical protein M9H77_02522 [Catharanthus roseus]|uniref:Uncharacterized protein n=1 Tax=Catharanthus roseus TaxID=4058 RepID=A0ACC0C8T9_CATRO|nr:hypothetical protein M9H77_02522 [Catharanthus roseus]
MDTKFYFLNSLGTLLEKKYFIEFNSLCCVIPRIHEYYHNVANYISNVLGIEDKGRNIEIEFGAILEELPESLLHSGSMLDLSYYDFGVMNNASIESIVVGFGLDDALFDILHDKYLGKIVENVGYVSSFLNTFIENHNDFVSLNQFMSFVSGQVELSCNEQKLANVINSLNTLFENTFGFQFYHLHFKEFLLKDFENRMRVNLGLFKVNPWAFEKSNLRKEAFEQVCKYYVVEHLYYHKTFKDWFLKLFILCPRFQKNSCASILKHVFEDILFIHQISKEVFDRVVSKEKYRPSWDFENFTSTFPHLNCQMMKFETHQGYSFILNSFVFIGAFGLSLPFSREEISNLRFS